MNYIYQEYAYRSYTDNLETVSLTEKQPYRITMNAVKTVNLKQLEEEFKLEFPDLPNEIILACINQHGPDKETCIKILKDIRQNYMFSENLPLQQMDKFNSEESSFRMESYDFKFNNSGFQDDHKSMVKDMNNLALVEKAENLEQNQSSNENTNVMPENQMVHTTNGNFLPMPQSSTSNIYDLSPHYRAANVGYMEALHNSFVPQKRNTTGVDQRDRTHDVPPQYVHNYARGFSYPVTNNINTAYNSQFSHPVSISGFSSGEPTTKDYSMPLYVMVTSASHYSSPSLTMTQPRLVLPQSTYYSTVLTPHLTPSYHTARISPVPFSHSSSSSSSPHYSSSTTPPLSTSSANAPPLVTYAYRGQLYFAENHQRSNEMPNHPQNAILNLPTAIMPHLPEVLFLPQHQINETKEHNVEKAYEKALVEHQRKQLQTLHFELYKNKQFSYALRKDVNLLEERLQGKRKNEFINMEEIQKLREENMQLRVDCKCLTLEFDMQQKGQMRLGVVDEGFYKNIFTGPPIPPSHNSEKKTDLSLKSSQYEGDDDDNQSHKWNCSKCTYANHPALEHCEMCYSARPSLDG